MHRVSCPFVLSLCLFSLFISNLPGAVFSGRILDPHGWGVPGASLLLVSREGDLHWSGVSALDGSFQSADVPAGGYWLRATASGFAAAALEVFPERGDRLEITLETNRLDESLVVTAAGTVQTLGDTAKAVTVIESAEIEGRDEYTLGDLLVTVPALRIQQLGGPQAFTSIRIRGLRAEDTALLIDGFRFRDPAAIGGDASSFLQDVLLTNNDRVEVLRGSGSSLYGTNAIGGVINLISHPGREGIQGNVKLQAGHLGLYRGAATLSGGTGDGRFLAGGGLSRLHLEEGLDRHDGARNTNGQVRVQYQLNPRLTLGSRLYAGKSSTFNNDSPFAPSSGNSAPGSVPVKPLAEEAQRRLEAGVPVELGDANLIPDLDDPDNRRRSHFLSSLTRLDYRAAAGVTVTLNYQFTQTRRLFSDGPAGVRFEPDGPTSSELDGRIHSAQLKGDFLAAGSQFLSAGFEFEQETSRGFDLGSGIQSRTRAGQGSRALFVQDQFALLRRRLQISLAARAQWFSLRTPRFEGEPGPYRESAGLPPPPPAYTGDLAAAWSPAGGTKLRAHIGNGYRVPSLYNRFGSTFFFGAFSYFGDPRLRPERSVSVDAGLDQQFLANRVRAGATVFYTRLLEVIDFEFGGVIDPVSDPFGRFGGYLNRKGGLVRGVETTLELTPAPAARISVSYTFTNADDAEASFPGFLKSMGIPDHQWTVVALYFPTPSWNLVFDYAGAGISHYRFAGAAEPLRFPGSDKADLGAQYRFPLSERSRLQFFAKATNLLDRRYLEGGFRTPGRGASGGVSFEF